jgi:hypothetical protein
MVLSSSTLEIDIRSAMNLHANSYFVKPPGFDGLVSLFVTIEEFWRNDVRFALPAAVGHQND